MQIQSINFTPYGIQKQNSSIGFKAQISCHEVGDIIETLQKNNSPQLKQLTQEMLDEFLPQYNPETRGQAYVNISDDLLEKLRIATGNGFEY